MWQRENRGGGGSGVAKEEAARATVTRVLLLRYIVCDSINQRNMLLQAAKKRNRISIENNGKAAFCGVMTSISMAASINNGGIC